MNQSTVPAATSTAESLVPTASPTPTAAPADGCASGAGPRGSDPPRDSGHPASRQAGEGAPEAGPRAPSEIDRSTDA